MKNKDLMAPVGSGGELLPTCSRYYSLEEEKWVSPRMVPATTTWELILTFDGFDKGRRGAYRFIATDIKGRKWPMFLRYFMEMMSKTVIREGVVIGTFEIVKRGVAYSLKYIERIEDDA